MATKSPNRYPNPAMSSYASPSKQPAMTSTTNPFDSEEKDEHVSSNNYNQNNNIHYDNDDYDDEQDSLFSSEEEYDEEDNYNLPPDTTTQFNNMNINSNNIAVNNGITNDIAASSTVPEESNIEASWQFLGDLPYRRIPLFDSVQWGTMPATDIENIRSDTNEPTTSTNTNTFTNNSTNTKKAKSPLDHYAPTNGRLTCISSTTLTNLSHQFSSSTSTLTQKDYVQLLSSTTKTLIASCPNGGPIATMTIPIIGGGMGMGMGMGMGGMGNPMSISSSAKSIHSAYQSTLVRVMTNSGELISQLHFPPRPQANISSSSGSNTNSSSSRGKTFTVATGSGNGGGGVVNTGAYTASDVLSMGFTKTFVLVIVMRDSACFTYDVSGKPILPPFYILHDSASTAAGGVGGGVGSAGASELMEASIYDGGVAVLSVSMTSAIVEILDEREDGNEEYRQGCHVASRIIRANDWKEEDTNRSGPGTTTSSSTFASKPTNTTPSANSSTSTNQTRPKSDWCDTFTSSKTFYAIITPLSTSTHAKSNYLTYTSISVLSRIHTPTRHPEVFLGTSTNSVLICDASAEGRVTDVACQERIDSPIVRMSFAPNGRFLACFTEGCVLTVLSTNFETKVLDFNTSDGSSDPPHGMEWCGEDSVVLHWKMLGVLMVGPYGDWLRFPYDEEEEFGHDLGRGGDGEKKKSHRRRRPSAIIENVHLCPEMDCCRIITDQSVEILQRVPPATAALLRMGSIEPSAMLLDASDVFDKGGAASDEATRAIVKTGMLQNAIEVCTDAAMREYDVKMQKRLLKAASYGMHFGYKDGSMKGVVGGSLIGTDVGMEGKAVLPSPTAVSFVTTARKMRVMNALRSKSVGFVLTSVQYDSITPNGIIARLIAMRRPALAMSIASYLQLDEHVKAYARAARGAAFVSTDVGHTDAETAEAVMKILSTGIRTPAMNRGGYATVALAASKAGRQGVANLLLTLEMSVVDKVPALTEIGLFADAAAVATNARNADLIFRTLVEFEKSCIVNVEDSATAQMTYLNTIVKKFPAEAMNYLSTYFGSMTDFKHAVKLQLRGHNFNAAGSLMAKRAVSMPKVQDKVRLLQEASKIFGSSKDTPFQKTCTDEYIELLSEQERLRRSYGSEIIPPTSSVTTTIFSVICFASKNMRETHKLLQEAEKLAKRFKVPDKRLWHVKVRAFAASGQWGNLRTLSESRSKPAIAFKYFATAAIQGKQSVGEILRYIDKVTDSDERYDLFCEAKQWKRAVQEAKKVGDVRKVLHVRSVVNDKDIQRICDDFLGSHA